MCAIQLARRDPAQILGHEPRRVQIDLVDRRELADTFRQRRREAARIAA